MTRVRDDGVAAAVAAGFRAASPPCFGRDALRSRLREAVPAYTIPPATARRVAAPLAWAPASAARGAAQACPRPRPALRSPGPSERSWRPGLIFRTTHELASRSGLYDPAHEHDACGVGFVISRGRFTGSYAKASRSLNLVHRGACGCDPSRVTAPGSRRCHEFFQRKERSSGSACRSGANTARAACLPRNPNAPAADRRRQVLAAGQRLLGWRTVPVDESALGRWRGRAR